MEKVRAFYETGMAGQELVLNAELSRGDRKAVHELCEELGIGHESTGTEGVDRYMKLTIPLPADSSSRRPREEADGTEEPPKQESVVVEAEDAELDIKEQPATFAALQTESDDEEEAEEAPNSNASTADNQPAMNSTLASLAKDRMLREQQKKQSAKPGNQKSKKKKKGQKLGGGSKKSAAEIPLDDIDDDMAFLEAQIERVQTAHGRKVEGSGTKYRTLVNGILTAKPTLPAGKKKDSRASSALQAKLKSAQNSRKQKGKPKK